MAELPATYHVEKASDISKGFLDQFLGPGWDSFGTGNLGGSAAPELALQIFSSFNLIVLTIVALLFIWTVVVGVIGTAHEGVPLGKRFSSVWSPLRFAFSIAALAPIFKGLSLFQVAMLALVGWSINLANYEWTLGNEYFFERAGQLSVDAPMQPTENFVEISNGILSSLVMQEAYITKRNADLTLGGGNWQYRVGGLPFLGSSAEAQGIPGIYVYNFDGGLGSVVIACSSQNDTMCQARREATDAAIKELKPVAQQIANIDLDAKDIDQIVPANTIAKMQNILVPAMAQKQQEGVSSLKNEMQFYKTTADQKGWVIAGASYWTISMINQKVRSEMFSNFKYVAPDKSYSDMKIELGITQDSSAILARLENFKNTAYGPRRGLPPELSMPSTTTGANPVDIITNYIEKTSAQLLNHQISSISQRDPVAALADIGDYMVQLTTTLIAIIVVILVGAAGVESVSFLGIGAKGVVQTVSTISLFFLFAVVVPLGTYGLLLAYLVPAIPFLIWMAGIAVWILQLLESLVAAPIWLAAHALPEGQGFAGQYGRRGYIIFLGVLIRPALMVTGFFLAVIMMNFAGEIIGSIFQFFVDGLRQTKMLGVTGSLCMMIIIGSLLIMFIKRAFSLINILPERVLSYLGDHLPSGMGEKEDANTAENSAKGGAGAISAPLNKASGVRPQRKAPKPNNGPQTPQGGPTVSAPATTQGSHV